MRLQWHHKPFVWQPQREAEMTMHTFNNLYGEISNVVWNN